MAIKSRPGANGRSCQKRSLPVRSIASPRVSEHTATTDRGSAPRPRPFALSTASLAVHSRQRSSIGNSKLFARYARSAAVVKISTVRPRIERAAGSALIPTLPTVETADQSRGLRICQKTEIYIARRNSTDVPMFHAQTRAPLEDVQAHVPKTSRSAMCAAAKRKASRVRTKSAKRCCSSRSSQASRSGAVRRVVEIDELLPDPDPSVLTRREKSTPHRAPTRELFNASRNWYPDLPVAPLPPSARCSASSPIV